MTNTKLSINITLMNLILFRHGPPVEAIEWLQTGKKEPERPLTEEGVQITKKASEGLKINLSSYSQEELLDCSIYSSPYKRALQTTNILKDTLQIKKEITVLEELIPHSHPRQFSNIAFSHTKSLLIAVGHQPLLSCLAGYLLFQEESASCLSIERAGALNIQINRGENMNQLLWLMTPQQLAAIRIS